MNIPARYTEVLKNLMDNEQTKPLIKKALSTYPLYEQRTKGEFIPVHIPTRDELNNAILNYYKYREIGFETVGRFLDELETAMCEIMPYYNQQFFSIDQDYDVLENANYTREIDRKRDIDRTNKIEGLENTSSEGSETGRNTSQVTSEGSDTNRNTTTTQTTAEDETTTNTSTTGNNKKVHSDTPQNQLSITAENIDNVSYADGVDWNKDQSSQTGTTNGESTTNGSSTSNTTGTSEAESNTTSNSNITRTENTDHTNEINTNGADNEQEKTFEHVRGNYGQITYQTLLEQYRKLIQNVTQNIINDKRIAELFMLVY